MPYDKIALQVVPEVHLQRLKFGGCGVGKVGPCFSILVQPECHRKYLQWCDASLFLYS